MKKLFYLLAAALMVLASVSCTKKMVPLYLKGTTWVCTEAGSLGVIKFDTRRTFHFDIYTGEFYEFTANYRIVEVIDDQVNFEFASISVEPGEGMDVAGEGMLLLHGRRSMEYVATSNHWRDIDERSRSQFFRDDSFNISKYVN